MKGNGYLEWTCWKIDFEKGVRRDLGEVGCGGNVFFKTFGK